MKTILLKESELVNLIKRTILQEQTPTINNMCDLCTVWYTFNAGSVQQNCNCPTCACGSNPQTGPNTSDCELCTQWYTFNPGSVQDNCNCSTCPCTDQSSVQVSEKPYFASDDNSEDIWPIKRCCNTSCDSCSTSCSGKLCARGGPKVTDSHPIQLRESELVNLIKNVINEQTAPQPGVGYAGGTPCYACINNQVETMLFPQNALGQPYPDCAPTAYGHQGQPGGLPGGSASYNYPSIWSEVPPTNCGGGTTGGNWTCAGSMGCIETVNTGQWATEQDCINNTSCGGGIPVCMGLTADACPPNSGQLLSTPSKCASINNIPVTQADVGKTIDTPMGGGRATVSSVFPNTSGNGAENYSLAGGPCGRPNITTGPTPQFEDPCEEFRTWPRVDQRDFCVDCRRGPDEPMCKCCR